MAIKSLMNHEMVTSMIAHLVLIPALFRNYKQYINFEGFKLEDPDMPLAEKPLLYIWKGLLLYYEAQPLSDAPSRELLSHYVDQALANDLASSQEMHDAIYDPDEEYGYMSYIYSPERKTLNTITGAELLRQFLVERNVIADVLRIAREAARDPSVINMGIGPDIDAVSERAKRINTLGAEVLPVPTIPDDDYYAVSDENLIVSSGIPFIDNGLGGGQRRGSVNGIIGCTGAGKTTLGLQLIVNNSRVNRAEVINGGDPELCLFYSFEQSASDILPTLQSNALNIGINSLRPRFNLSTDLTNKKEYESILWPDSASWVSERQRWEENKDWLNQSIIIQNFSGVPDKTDVTPEQMMLKRNRGVGGIDEIQGDVEQLVANYHRNVRVIVIDYAGLVRYRQYGCNMEDSAFYNALAYMGDACRKQLAGRFNCVVWLLHQIAGASNGLSPLQTMHHSKAAGCKSFADNIDTCLCLGNPDNGSPDRNQGKSLYATFSKTRYTGGNGFDASNRIIQHNPWIRRLDDVTETYMADPANHGFMPREREYGQF